MIAKLAQMIEEARDRAVEALYADDEMNVAMSARKIALQEVYQPCPAIPR